MANLRGAAVAGVVIAFHPSFDFGNVRSGRKTRQKRLWSGFDDHHFAMGGTDNLSVTAREVREKQGVV